MYRVSSEQVTIDQIAYKKSYEPFRPFTLAGADIFEVGKRYYSMFETQNGCDTDDYAVEDNNKVERYLRDLPRGKLLLLGVGTGREILIGNSMGFETQGITFGSRNVDFGHKYLGLSKSELFEAAIECMPCAPEIYDIVAGFQILEHALAPLFFLLQIGRIMKTGGVLILEWPPANDHYTGGSNPHHQICFTPGQAKALFEKAGFGNIELIYDDLTAIPPEEYWKGEQTKMLVIKGTKLPATQEYIKKAWSK